MTFFGHDICEKFFFEWIAMENIFRKKKKCGEMNHLKLMKRIFQKQCAVN